MPYLTLWDKISQNLAHLEGNSHKKIKSHRIFRPFCNRFYEEINIQHTLLWFSQASYMKEKDIRLYLGSAKVMFKKISQNFVKSPLKFGLISQIFVKSLWHIWCTDVTSQPNAKGPTPAFCSQGHKKKFILFISGTFFIAHCILLHKTWAQLFKANDVVS